MPEYKGWSIPLSVELVEDLQAMNCTLAQEIQLAYYDKKKCLDQAKLQKFNEKVIAKEPMPIKAKAYEHQIRGYNIACEIMDLFN